MCASILLQTSLKHVLFEEMHKHMAQLFIQQSNLQEDSMKIPLQSKPYSFKQLPMSPFEQSIFVECYSHCSYFSEQYTSLNCIFSGNNDNLTPYTNLALIYHISMPCRMHSIHIQYCWYPQYLIF